MKKIVLCLAVLMLIVTGCGESKKRATWGQGELPPEWQEVFGADNGSRMDYVQTNKLNEINARLKVVEEFLRITEVAE